MSDQPFYEVWWNDDTRNEQDMENDHQAHWSKVIQMITEPDLTSFHVLDFGCNQGGFLRYLHSQKPFQSGTGVDLATKSIEVANSRKKDLPLTYEVTANVDQYNQTYDLAFSISVIYLLQNLPEHAWKMKQALKRGGVYYCTYTDYSKNPSLLNYKKQVDHSASLPMQLHSLDDIADAFTNEGFKIELRRMPSPGFITIPVNDRWFNAIADRMQYEYQEAYIFRFTAPGK